MTFVSLGFALLPALVVGALAAFLVLDRVIGARRRPFRDELARRYGSAPYQSYVAEAVALFESENPPDAICLLSAVALPHGGRRWVRAPVWKGPSALSDLPPEVRDGLPCEIMVVERGTRTQFTGRCNLAGLPDRLIHHPTVAFCNAMLDASKALARIGLFWGACSATGDVSLGRES